MDVLFLILLNVICPVFVLIAVGALLHRKFKFDMNTLSKITTYFLMPAIGFVNIYESKMAGNVVAQIIGFLALQGVAMMILASLTTRVFKFERSLAATFKNSVVLINSGNYGLPVSQLVFSSNPLGASIQVIVMIFQNLLTYTYGLWNSVSANQQGARSSVIEFLKIPILYFMLAAFFLNMFDIELPVYLWNPIKNTSDAFLAIALLTLGAQCAYLDFKQITLPLLISVVGRLIVAPLIAMGIIFLLGLDGTVAQALLIASSFPSSRNSAQFALEYNNHPEYAAQVVLVSTLLSSLTVTVVVYVSKILF